MGKGKILLTAGLALLCLVGWIAFGVQRSAPASAYESLVATGDDWAGRGLYQRAILKYNEALKEKQTPELYEKINAAYRKRYAETPEDTREDYMSFLRGAVAAYPGNSTLVDSFVGQFLTEERYGEVYSCLKNAIAAGYDTAQVRGALRDARYAYGLRGGAYRGILQGGTDYYTVLREKGWSVYSAEDGYSDTGTYDAMSRCSAAGRFVATRDDSRLMDLTGMVWGIFPQKVEDAGILAEGLIPAKCGGSYAYYNDLAEKQFGAFDLAGTFQDGRAAVKKGTQWYLIDRTGQSVSEPYEEIVLNPAGEYACGGKMLARTGGSFGLFDLKGKRLCTLAYDSVDVLTDDGLIAVCKGGLWGFANIAGELVIQPKYQDARSFSHGLAAVCVDGLWGWIDPEGAMVIQPAFREAGYFSAKGLCPVRLMPETEGGEAEETAADWRLLELKIGIVED